MTVGVGVRPATEKDAELLWAWRNDPFVRENSFKTEPIEWGDHLKWFELRLSSPETRIYILDRDGLPVAQVRYERRNKEMAEIGDISVSSGDRGKGYGKAALALTLEMACAELSVRKIHAVVKPGNVASSKMFQSAGFTPMGEATIKGVRCETFLYLEPRETMHT
jgi:RimJ/RimL family protein N-acetyltransferase